jgi:polysaccharide chain length determinant protein (PEP-CTERM system associated)
MTQDKTAFDLQKYWKIFLKRKWYAIIPALAISAISIYHAANRPDVYYAKCVLLVERFEFLPNVLKDGTWAESDTNRVLQAVKEKMLGWESVKNVIEKTGMEQGISKNDERSLEGLYHGIVNNTSIKVKENNLITVAYKGPDPDIDFKVVDELVSYFIQKNLETTHYEVDTTLELIDHDLRKLKNELEESDAKLKAFEEAHYSDLPGSENSKLAKLSTAEYELLSAGHKISEQKRRLHDLGKKLDKEPKTTIGKVIEIPNPKRAKLEEQIGLLGVELEKSRTMYHDKHPRIIAARKKIEALENKIQNESGKVIGAEEKITNPIYTEMLRIKTKEELDLGSLSTKREELIASIKILKEQVKSVPEIRQKLERLKRDYEVKKGLYEQRLLQRSRASLRKKTLVKQNLNPFTIIEPTRVSHVPLGGDKSKTMLLGMVLGLGMGFGLVLGMDRIDQRFKSAQEVKNLLKIPHLCSIPSIPTKTVIEKQRKRRQLTFTVLIILALTVVMVCILVGPVRYLVLHLFGKFGV